MRSSIPALLLAALAALALPACSSLGPSDEPLPTFEELQARYGPQAPGNGTLSLNGTRYDVTAVHITTGKEYGEPSLTRFYVDLRGGADGSVSLFAEGVTPSTLRPGQELGIGVVGTGDGNGGGGRLRITAVEGGRIAGVFAADLRPGGLYPDFRRIEGAFNAVPDSTR